MLKILHLAPQNYAGVPYSFSQMHNACGDYSRIITFHKNPLEFPEDICLNWSLPNFSLAQKWRRKKVDNLQNNPALKAPIFKPKNIVESTYFKVTDFFRKADIVKLVAEFNLDDFDIIHYDAGLDFFRNSAQAKKWKKQGKKIVCCYYGSDLRIRGLIKELDLISDLNVTSEFDHLALKKDLHYLFYPYDPSELPQRKINESGKIRIIHSPTNRKYKGTDLIISVIDKIKKERNIEFILRENIKRSVLLKEKSTSDISIDQVGGNMGGTGYGKAGLETLAMGIPTITNMSFEYAEWLPENPFVVANNEKELYNCLIELIDSSSLRNDLGENGKKWVEKYHGFRQVDTRLKELYKQNNII